ncbi:hypothetical protein V6N13_060465 [Hibiscus sabdariffa]|uniref:Uncharacterized protein n=1 Tax=Hibiscus sabdariffa TaxID=183260 RepID=A0ABR2GAU8_9ROSI
MDFTRIFPEECLCLTISFTSPADACRAFIYTVATLYIRGAIGFKGISVGLNVDVNGIASSQVRRVSLDYRDEPRHVRERGDGWIEVEMGEFFNEYGDDGTLDFILKEVDGYYKEGLIIEGIELRPKDVGS